MERNSFSSADETVQPRDGIAVKLIQWSAIVFLAENWPGDVNFRGDHPPSLGLSTDEKRLLRAILIWLISLDNMRMSSDKMRTHNHRLETHKEKPSWLPDYF
jgi:hypothetical protein